MIDVVDFLPLLYTRDLTEGGIAYALRSLPHSFTGTKGSVYDRLRRLVAGTAVDLAFRRYLSEKNISFEVKRALPFTERDRYDVILAGRRCEAKSFLISHPDQILQIQHHPKFLLNAPALVASDHHAAEGHSPRDLYLFAFHTGRVTTSQKDMRGVSEGQLPSYLLHVMPAGWKYPSRWNPLGKLILKSESEETQIVELNGQDESHELRSCAVVLPPRTRVEIQNEFFSLTYVHTKSSSLERIGIHSPMRQETHIIGKSDWSNIWVHSLALLLVGYITREEFSRRASFIPAGSRVFQYNSTQVKNLAVPVSALRPLSELFERVKIASSVTTA
jgi:hypothetical protein